MKFFVVSLSAIFILLPFGAYALCSPDGYTVVYINGILTSQGDASDDTNALQRQFIKKSNLKDVVFRTGHNQSHLAGAGDLIESASQLLGSSINNYDRDTILLQIHPQVTTRKILLVGHSQGTFYTNEIYDYLISHGESKEAISVYNIATPASFVSGDGEYLTSQNDKVINAVRNAASKIGAKQPLSANITIPLTAEEAANSYGGHSFSGVYLANDSVRIVSDVEDAIKKLVSAEVPNTADASCFTPPAKGLAYYAQKSVFSVADAAATGVVATNRAIALVGETAYNGALAATQSAVAATETGFKNTLAVFQINVVKDFFHTLVFGNAGQYENLKLVAQISLSNKDSDSMEAVGEKKSEQAERREEVDNGNNPVTASNGADIQTRQSVNEEDEDAKEQAAKKPGPERLAASLPSVLPTSQAPAPASLPAGGAGQGEATFKQCAYETSGTPTRQNFLINEVAWMGGPVSANDEWVELKNISSATLDVSGWQLIDKGEQIKVTIINGTKLAAGAYLLLERTDDDSLPGVAADIIYTGALSNTDEGLRLFDKDCALIDEVTANSDWPAGDSAARKTMERSADLGWHTYNGGGEVLGGVTIMGTPQKDNSIPATTNDQQQMTNDNQATTNSQQETPNHLVISEIQITGGSGQTTDDFIEIYNPMDSAFNLNGHRLVKRTKTGTSDTSIKSWTSDAFIPAKGFYLWANSSYADIAVTPDATTAASIADDNGIALRLGAEDTGTIIDSVAWGEAENIFAEAARFPTNPDANQSLERKALKDGSCVSVASGQSGEFLGHTCDANNNSADFELRASASPQHSQSFPEPRSAPLTISNFNAEYNPLTLGISFNWNASADYAGATSSLQYILSYATSSSTSLNSLAALNATTSYYFKAKEIGTNYSFSISAKDAEGLVSTTTSQELTIPSLLTNLYWYPDPRSASTTAVELRYNSYPFIPDIYSQGDTWKVAIFYKNQEALTIPYFYSDLQYATTPDGVTPKQYGEWGSDIPGTVKLKYSNCSGGFSYKTAIIFPDTAGQCSNGYGGIRNSSLQWNQLEDLILIVNQSEDQPAPAAGDYLTAAFYADSGFNTQTLVAVDRQKYLFQDSPPAHQPPELNSDLAVNFNPDKSKLTVSWEAAVDDDTLDSLIRYEINYATTTEFRENEWQSRSEE